MNSNELDGASRVIYELARELQDRLDVIVYVPIIPRYRLFVLQECRNLGKTASLAIKIHYCLRWIAIEFFVRRLKWVYDPGAVLSPKRCIFSPAIHHLRECDYLVLNSWYHVMAFKDFWEDIKGKVVIYHHHHEEYKEQNVRELRDKIYNSTRSITVSKNSYQHLSSKKVATPEIIFNGINNSIFKLPDETSKEKQRVIDIALYRGFEKRKGFEVGLEAINSLSAKYRLNCCIIQGSKRAKVPWNYPVYSELSDKDLADILQAIKIFVYPSLFEGFGMPPLEAMACGCAVVTTRVGAIPEYASHMRDACIVEPGSAVEIEQAIEYLLEHPNEMLRIQKNAVKTALNYTWAKTAQSFIHFLEK